MSVREQIRYDVKATAFKIPPVSLWSSGLQVVMRKAVESRRALEVCGKV